MSGKAAEQDAEASAVQRNSSGSSIVAPGDLKGGSEQGAQRSCCLCNVAQPRAAFSKRQWKRKHNDGTVASKCKTCCGDAGSAVGTTNDVSASARAKRKGTNAVTETVTIPIRPQISVPAFDGLTCCSDWPKTKNGKVPNAQSTVFVPLIACAIGPIGGYCTAKQLEVAMRWWTAALPAWPQWVQELRNNAALDQRSRLIQRAKGTPNSLIPKKKRVGKVPHFKGTDQVAFLESVPLVAAQVDACIMCMYSHRP